MHIRIWKTIGILANKANGSIQTEHEDNKSFSLTKFLSRTKYYSNNGDEMCTAQQSTAAQCYSDDSLRSVCTFLHTTTKWSFIDMFVCMFFFRCTMFTEHKIACSRLLASVCWHIVNFATFSLFIVFSSTCALSISISPFYSNISDMSQSMPKKKNVDIEMSAGDKIRSVGVAIEACSIQQTLLHAMSRTCVEWIVKSKASKHQSNNHRKVSWSEDIIKNASKQSKGTNP